MSKTRNEKTGKFVWTEEEVATTDEQLDADAKKVEKEKADAEAKQKADAKKVA